MMKLHLNEKAKQARIKAGLTQMDVASMLRLELGIKASVSALQKWERGAKPVTAEAALGIARILGIKEVDDIVVRKEVAHTR